MLLKKFLSLAHHEGRTVFPHGQHAMWTKQLWTKGVRLHHELATEPDSIVHMALFLET